MIWKPFGWSTEDRPSMVSPAIDDCSVGTTAAMSLLAPERMLPDVKKTRPRHHYLPFGGGPRVCIGAHFALLEGQLALATMVQRATVRPIPRHVEPEPLVTLRPRGGLPAIVSPRTAGAARVPADRTTAPAPTRETGSRR